MKGQISRYSWSEPKHYSGVYQVQGGMVTDADLGETSEIARARTDQLGDGAIHDGVPARDGIVAVSGGKPALRPGVVFADGVRGVVSAATGFNAAQPLDLYLHQADFPAPPAAGAGLYYVDIWQRPVFALEDGELTDVGLHGAETSFRGKTMAQIRRSPANVGGQPARAMIEAGNGAFPQRGNAVLGLAAASTAQPADTCDPCADEIAVDLRIPNALLRLEVVHVVGPANAPTRVDLAWSRENAAEQYPVGSVPPGFADSGVFEFFSPTTESHMGAFAAPGERRRSAFAAAFPGQPRARDDGGAGGWPLVRRWDGHVEVNLAGSAITASGKGFQATLDTAGGAFTVEIALDTATLRLDLKGKSVLAGDFWLVEMREFAAAPVRVRTLNGGLPVGIEHHYCVLFETAADGTPGPLDDRDRRRLNFPALSDMPASSIGFDSTCPKLFPTAKNVQQALDELCDIEAADIAFDNQCPKLYGDAKTVQQALAKLCDIDLAGSVGYREMFDWGVVCGLDVRSVEIGTKATVRVTQGTFLDRAGRFVAVEKPIEFSLNDPTMVTIHAGSSDGDNQPFCLAIERTDKDELHLHLLDADEAFGGEDPGFCQRVTDCQTGKGVFNPFIDVAVSAADRAIIDKVLFASANPALRGAIRVPKAEAERVESYLATVADTVKAQSSAEDHRNFLSGIKAISGRFGTLNAAGDVHDLNRGLKYVETFDYLREDTQKKLRDCVRSAIIVPCPPPLDERPYLVPLGAIKGGVKAGVARLDATFVTRHRKQALTLRAMRYRQRGGWENDLDWFHAYIEEKQYYFYGQLVASLEGFQRVPEFLKADCLMDARNATENRTPPFKPDLTIPPLLYEDVLPWDPRPKVFDKGIEEARRILVGNGVDVSEVIDMKAAGALDALVKRLDGDGLAARLEAGERIAPGDKVALLQVDGVSQGFVVLQKGTGLAFNAPAAIATAPTVMAPAFDNAAVLAQIKQAEQLQEAVRTDLKSLTDSRAAIEQQVKQLQAQTADFTRLRADTLELVKTSKLDLTAMEGQREAVRGDLKSLTDSRSALEQQVKQLQAQSAEFTKLSKDTAELVKTSKADLTAMEGQRDAIIKSIQAATPALAVTPDAAAATKLANAGFTNVLDVVNMDDNKAKLLVDNGTFKREELKVIRDRAQLFKPR